MQRPGDMAKGHLLPSDAFIPSRLEMFSIRTVNFVISPFIISPFIISWARPGTAAAKMRTTDKVKILTSIVFYLLYQVFRPAFGPGLLLDVLLDTCQRQKDAPRRKNPQNSYQLNGRSMKP